MRQIFILGLFCLPIFGFTQVSDCPHPIPIGNDLQFNAKNISGAGKTVEFRNNKLGNKYYFTEEHNTIWYSFTADRWAEMYFEITPDDPEDDWDFLLFQVKGKADCEAIVTKQLPPIRTNLARNNPANKGVTGLALKEERKYVAAGPSSNLSKYVEVHKGEQFLLVVDNNKQAGKGHSLQFFLLDLGDEEPVEEPEPLPVVEKKEHEIQTSYQFAFFDQETSEPLYCEGKIIFENYDFGEDSIYVFQDEKELNFTVKASQNFSLNLSKENYLFVSKNFRSFRMDSSIVQKFFIPKAEEGEMISLPDINFRENTTHLLTNSVNALQQIHDFMVNNPDAVIEIRGHVNAPGYENQGRVKKFSEKRAEEVKDFLVGMGIDGRRMQTVGLGNEFMIYPNPVDYQQQKANRRVEIVILKN